MNKNITCYDTVWIGKKMYFFAVEYNLLLKIGSDMNLHYESSIPEKKIISNHLVSKLLCYNNTLICIPFNGDKLWIYEIKSKCWDSIDIVDEEKTCVMFLSAVLYKEHLYLLPAQYSKMIMVDLEKKEATYIDILEKYSYIKNCNYVKFRMDIVINDFKIYAVLCSKNLIMKFDVEGNTYEWIEVPVINEGMSGITFDGEYYWISLKNSSEKIIKWDGDNYFDLVSVEKKGIGKTRGITFWKGKLYIKKEDYTLQMDVATQKVSRIEEKILFMDTISGMKKISFEGYYEDDKIDRKCLFLNSEIKKIIVKHPTFEKRKKCEESVYFDLEDFVYSIM